MMPSSLRFPYQANSSLGGSAGLPYLPISLTRGGNSVDVTALVDSGSTLNVLPYDVGAKLGADWDRQRIDVTLSGALSSVEARAILLSATVGGFAPVQLAFAWTRSTDVPTILGQVNFFMEFDVCFFRSALAFEIRSKRTP